MRSRLLLPLALAALSSWQVPRASAQAEAASPAAQPAAKAPWVRYSPTGEEFSVEVPGKPAVFHTARVIKNSPPYESDTMRVFGLYSEGVVYMIASYDRPRPYESLDSFANYIWGRRGLAPVRDLKLGESSGREYQVSLYDLKGAARVFRTEKHAYLLKAFANAEGHQQAVERFLNSLVLEARHSVEPGRSPSEGVGPGKLLPERREGESAAAGDGPFAPRDVTRKALLVFKPEPGFTEKARRSNTTGVVRLRAVLSSSGLVTKIQIVKELPNGLTEKAVNAARHLLFFPAEKDGRQVSQYVVLEYNFNIY